MRASLNLERRATYADYLAAEQASEARHEFIDGVIVAMPGGSDEHNAIAMRFGGLCMARLSGRCRPYTADQRFWIAATARGRYCDGSIICGPPEHAAHDEQATTNPIVVIEVLPALASPISVAELYDGVLDAAGKSLLRERSS